MLVDGRFKRPFVYKFNSALPQKVRHQHNMAVTMDLKSDGVIFLVKQSLFGFDILSAF